MRTFYDINFDKNYLHLTIQFLLLDDLNTNTVGPTPVIELPNALIMTFIQVFDNILKCQRYINSENRKTIKLCISNRNILDWNNNIQAIDNNINEVYIFCDTYSDYIMMRRWDGCYRNKIRGIHLPHEVDRQLLVLGLDYIHSILPEVVEDRGLRRVYRSDARRILEALSEYFQEQMDDQDDE